MAIKSKNFNKKLARAKWWSDLRFKVRKLRFMRKILKYFLKQATANNNYKDVNELQLFPSDFRGLSDKQIERGLDMFVTRGELATWSHINEQNADGYLVVFPDENRSQERFLSRIPQKINLNEVHTEPLQQKQQENYAKNLSEEPSEVSHPEQTTLSEDEIFDAINKARHLELVKEPAEKMLDAKQPVHAEPTKQTESTTPKRKSIWDD